MRNCCSYSLHLILACIVVGQYALVKIIVLGTIYYYLETLRNCHYIVVSHDIADHFSTTQRCQFSPTRLAVRTRAPNNTIILTLRAALLAIIGYNTHVGRHRNSA